MSASERVRQRLSGGESPREALLRAARKLFPEKGFSQTSVRILAAEAGVDPTLITRHFGSKEALFIESVIPTPPAEPQTSWAEGPIDSLGRRIVERVIDQAPLEQRTYVAIVRASDNDEIRAQLNQLAETSFTLPLLSLLAEPHRELRAHLITAQLTGLQIALSVQGDETLAKEDRDALVHFYGKAIQAVVSD